MQLRSRNLSQSITTSLKVSVECLKTSTIAYKIFSDVFSEDFGALPGSVQLTLKPDGEPIHCPPKRLPIQIG